MNSKQNTVRILIFLILVFGVPWAAALAAAQSWLLPNEPGGAVAIVNVCFIAFPWLATIITRLVTKEGFKNLWLWPRFRQNGRYYAGVWLLPLLAVLAGGLIYYVIYRQSFDPNLGEVRKLMQGAASAANTSPWVFLLTILLSILFISSPVNMVLSLGEELGWRGYVLQKLMERFSARSAVGGRNTSMGLIASKRMGLSAPGALSAALLTGLIHGVWHTPLILLTANLTRGEAIPAIAAFLLFTCAMSILLAWGTLNSGSVWPAALGHGTVNALAGLPGYFLTGRSVLWIGPGPTGLIGVIGFALLALYLIIRKPSAAQLKGMANG